MFGHQEFERKKRKFIGIIEGKKWWSKIKSKFKVNEIFVYIISN